MIQFQLQKFEGPLDLLLYLIRKEEMDIFDIPVHEITKQYMDYIKLMQELDLEVAGEFVAMAATLIQIKSRMLLPQYGENGEIIEQEDPRKELVQRLLEYEKYKEAASKLYERSLLNRDVWSRGIREKLEVKDDEILLEENALFSLITSYRFVFRAMKKRVHRVSAKTQSIASRILEIKDRLHVGLKVAMSDLLDVIEDRRRQVLITFLSILELGKMGFVSIYQTENYAEIYVEAKTKVETAAISHVEEYDSLNADEIAEQMAAKAMQITEDDFSDELPLETAARESAEAEALAEAPTLELADIATDEEIALAEMMDQTHDLEGTHEVKEPDAEV